MAVKEITDRASSIEFDMVTLRFDKSHPKFERLGNVNVYRIGGGLGYLSKIFFIPQAALFALRRKYDLYWCIMTYMLFPAVLSRKAPWILTLQDGDPFTHVFNRLRILIFLPLLSYGFKHAKSVTAISNFLAKWSKRPDAIVIPNGVDTERFQNVKHRVFDKNKIRLITTSRLVQKNGVEDIIKSLKFLPENVTLRILGSGPLEKSLKLKANSLQLQNRIEFLGEIPHFDISKYLHEADIFIRPSLSEGMGNSFIEAMAAGLPVIGTPVGGIVDFLRDGETGLFCEVKNPKSIADRVMEYINNPELTSQIVKNAKKMVQEKYDWNLIAREMRSRVFKV